VFFFDRNCWPIVWGHQAAGNWRRGFQICDGDDVDVREVVLKLLGVPSQRERWCAGNGLKLKFKMLLLFATKREMTSAERRDVRPKIRRLRTV
jgi:hypothetical protein